MIAIKANNYQHNNYNSIIIIHVGTSFIAEEEKHIAAVQRAMKEKGKLNHTIFHGVFVGPARSGKNSLMERLLGRMPSSISPSTGVAERVVQVQVVQKSATMAANVEDLIWSVIDYEDEVIKFMLINSESQRMVPGMVSDPLDSLSPLATSADASKRDALKSAIDSSVQFMEAGSNASTATETTQHPLPSRHHLKLPRSVSPMEIFKRASRNKG